MKINLTAMEVFTTLDKSQCQVVNGSKIIANLIYSQGNGLGLAGQALAVKMWNDDGTAEYDDDEINIIKAIVEKYTAPCFIEAFETKLNITN